MAGWLARATRTIRERTARESGQSLILFAAGLAGFCGLVGMAVDVGQVAYTKADLQKIADAAALAAVQDLPGSLDTATSTANTYAGHNGSATITITFSTTTVVNDTITVSATRHVDYTFLKAVGLDGADPSATAKAKATQGAPVTGYTWASPNVAPFTIWGGSRQHEVNQGDSMCNLHTCVGRSYTFLDSGWMNASGNPTVPGWTASNSENFKGDQDHGSGAPVNNIGDYVSDGGLGSVTAPAVGTILVVPVVDTVSGNSNLRTFHIAAWAVVKVDSNCTKTHCTGTIQSTSTAAPAGAVTTGSVPPPASLGYKTSGGSSLLQ